MRKRRVTNAQAVLILLLVLLLVAGAVAIRRSHKHRQSDSASFDYYVLSISWAPEYCATHPADTSAECRPGNHTGFVLHGLWPQSQNGPPPMNCHPASPVSSAIVRHMLEYFPSRSLVQHEWAKHGTCTGLSAQDYFGKVEQAFNELKLPDRFRNPEHDQSLNPVDIERAFATANSAPPEAFRVSCHNKELVSVEACLTRDLKYQVCTTSVRECTTNQVRLQAR